MWEPLNGQSLEIYMSSVVKFDSFVRFQTFTVIWLYPIRKCSNSSNPSRSYSISKDSSSSDSESDSSIFLHISSHPNLTIGLLFNSQSSPTFPMTTTLLFFSTKKTGEKIGRIIAASPCCTSVYSPFFWWTVIRTSYINSAVSIRPKSLSKTVISVRDKLWRTLQVPLDWPTKMNLFVESVPR